MRTILILAFFTGALSAQLQNTVPRIQSSKNGDMPSLKDFGAMGDTQKIYNNFSMSAGSPTLTVSGNVGGTNISAIAATSMAQSVTFTNLTADYRGYIVMNYGGADTETVLCNVSVNNTVCTGIFNHAHPSGETEISARFLPSDVTTPAKQVRVSGAGPNTANLWHTSFASGGVGTTTTQAAYGGYTARSTDAYIEFSAEAIGAPVTWSLWGSNTITGVAASCVAGSTMVFSNTSLQPIGGAVNSWNNRDTVKIVNPGFAYYCFQVASTSGTGNFWISQVSEGYVLSATLTAYVDPFTVTLSANAANNVSIVAGMWGTDDTVALETAIASVGGGGPVAFGRSSSLFIPTGTYFVSQSILVNTFLNFKGQDAYASTIAFDPAMTPSTSSDPGGPALTYLWENTGDFGITMRDMALDCNEVQGVDSNLYWFNMQENSGADDLFLWQPYGHRGMYVLLGDNMTFRNMSINGAYRTLPQPKSYINQATVTGGSGSQTVTVNSTAMWTTGEQKDVGWLTSTRETVTITVVDATHVSGVFLKNHVATDALTMTNQAIGAEFATYGGMTLDQITTFPGSEFTSGGEGIGIKASGVSGHAIHCEGAIVCWDDESVGGGAPVDGVSGNLNVASSVVTYATISSASNIFGPSTWQWFDGVNNEIDASYAAKRHSTTTSGIGEYLSGGGFQNYFNGTVVITPANIFGTGGLFTKQLEIGSGPPISAGGSVVLGSALNSPQLEWTQGCSSEELTAFVGNNGTGTAGVLGSGTFPSICSPAGPGLLAALTIESSGNNVFLNRLAFGSEVGIAGGVGNTYYSLEFGSPITTVGNYSYRWTQDGSSQSTMHLKVTPNWGTTYTDVFNYNGGTNIFTVPNLQINSLASAGHLLIDTGSCSTATVCDSTSAQAWTFLGNIPLANFNGGTGAGVTNAVWCGNLTWCVTPTLATPGNSATAPLGFNTTWFDFTPATMMSFLGAAVTPTANQPLVYTTGGTPAVSTMSPATLAAYITSGTTTSLHAVCWASGEIGDCGAAPVLLSGGVTTGRPAVFGATLNTLVDPGTVTSGTFVLPGTTNGTVTVANGLITNFLAPLFTTSSQHFLNAPSGVLADAGLAARVVSVPATSTTTCQIGQVAQSSTFFYSCYATNTWVRVAMATF